MSVSSCCVFRYKVTVKQIAEHGGASLLKNEHKGSPFSLLSTVYKEHEFLPWLFLSSKRGIFEDPATRRKYIKWLMKQVNVSNPNQLTWVHFRTHKGFALLDMFGDSPSRIVQSLEDDGMASKSQTSPILYNDASVSKGHWVSLASIAPSFPYML